jgi:murein DD-endopeptidase MepM/ murein hydrolase activator NlpD
MTKIYEVVVEKPRITSSFGYRIDPITGKKKYHNGLDEVSKVKNRNLYAIDTGYVQKTVTGQDKSKTGYGNYIWVRYPRYNLSLLYAHCNKVLLKKGDKVKKGDVVAIMGTTGKSTGVHLHLGMTRIGSNTWLNPVKYDMLSDKYNLTRTLRKGSKGNDVKKLQKEVGTKADGIFGNNTRTAVIKFQKNNKLTADGIVGKNTAHALGWTYKGK